MSMIMKLDNIPFICLLSRVVISKHFFFQSLWNLSPNRIFHERTIYKTYKKESFSGEAGEAQDPAELASTVLSASLTKILLWTISSHK